jgi:TonB family protein
VSATIPKYRDGKAAKRAGEPEDLPHYTSQKVFEGKAVKEADFCASPVFLGDRGFYMMKINWQHPSHALSENSRVTKMKGFFCGALVSVCIHTAIIFLLVVSSPALLHVQAIPGSIAVSLVTNGLHQTRQGQRVAPTKGSQPTPKGQDTTEARPHLAPEGEFIPPEVEDGSAGIPHADTRGDSPQAIPQYGANQKPPYPELAQRQGYEGTVRLVVEVLASGSVGEISIKKSSGYEVLDQSAFMTVKKWRFTPARFAGIPVRSTVIVPITFRLKG